MGQVLKVFFSRSMLLVLLTGFSSGLPLALTGTLLQAWMKELKVDLSTIGLFSLVGLPYTIKFLWAPLMDRYVPLSWAAQYGFGRRRGWMIVTQLLLIISIAVIGMCDPQQHLGLVAVLALAISFFSASQDVVIDAFRTELLTPVERPVGASITNLGYRLAMLTSGGFALYLADRMSFTEVYWLMAASMLIGLGASLLAAEPQVEAGPAKPFLKSYIEPLFEFLKRRGAIEILVFVLIYKIDIVLAVALTTPFMLELGFTKTEIGVVTKGVGMISSIIGSLVGAAWSVKLGLKRSLWIFGIIQGLSTLSFAVLAVMGKDLTLMAAVVSFENFCAGLATGPFIAFLMNLCNQKFTGTQYALLSSFAAITRVVAGAPSGYMVEAMGWPLYFQMCALTAIPGLLLLMTRYDHWGVEKQP